MASLCNISIRIRSSKMLFGTIPYVASKEIFTEKFRHHPVYNIGSCVWQLDRESIPNECILGIASSDTCGNVGKATTLKLVFIMFNLLL